ncbi:MAG: NfeD family protein [Sphingomonadaceae bacterium]
METASPLLWLFSPWGWLSVAAVAAGLEILLPGAFMIWLAAAALATAIATLLLSLGVGWQMGAFALFAFLAVMASLQLKRRHPITSDDPALNRRGVRLVGEHVTVVVALAGGEGRVRLGDTVWTAHGADAPVGARLVVTGLSGNALQVSPVPE